MLGWDTLWMLPPLKGRCRRWRERKESVKVTWYRLLHPPCGRNKNENNDHVRPMKKSFEMVDYQLVNLAEVALIVEATFEALLRYLQEHIFGTLKQTNIFLSVILMND